MRATAQRASSPKFDAKRCELCARRIEHLFLFKSRAAPLAAITYALSLALAPHSHRRSAHSRSRLARSLLKTASLSIFHSLSDAPVGYDESDIMPQRPHTVTWSGPPVHPVPDDGFLSTPHGSLPSPKRLMRI